MDEGTSLERGRVAISKLRVRTSWEEEKLDIHGQGTMWKCLKGAGGTF